MAIFIDEEGGKVTLPRFPYQAIFNTPFQQYNSRIGQRCEVLGRNRGPEVDPAVLLFKVRFEDGYETDAFPEEVGFGQFQVGDTWLSGTKLS